MVQHLANYRRDRPDQYAVGEEGDTVWPSARVVGGKDDVSYGLGVRDLGIEDLLYSSALPKEVIKPRPVNLGGFGPNLLPVFLGDLGHLLGVVGGLVISAIASSLLPEHPDPSPQRG